MLKIRVLIADDHRMLGEGLVSLLLREADLEVIALADSGPHALDVVEKERPDIAIVDVCMPDMNGFETAKQIRRRVPECRVIGLSAFAEPLFVQQMAAAGADGFVLKNQSAAVLAGTIRAVHAGQKCFPVPFDDVLAAARAELSGQERAVLAHIAKGRRPREIAAAMDISAKTVDTYRRRIMLKLGLESPLALVRYAAVLNVREADELDVGETT